MKSEREAALRLGVLIPCRNEAAVIGRKLANLALARWPQGGRPHRIVVVDDGSEDGTAELARARAAELFAGSQDAVVSVVANAVRPGKPGAIRQGLAELESDADLIVLTDADVLLDPGALAAFARAFEQDPGLAMACGAQRFARDLAGDGTCRSAALGDPVDATEAFDRWTARVRRLESRFGRLFSVHGQLLAWRASLDFGPRPGIAADDLDLMLQVRARSAPPTRIALVGEAVFHEVKTPAGPERSRQALRRARAYVQVVRQSRAPPGGLAARLQWGFYRRVPLAAPAATAIVPLAAVGIAWASLGAGGAIAAVALALLAFTSGPGWRWLKLVRVIREARRREDEQTLSERWEMARR